ncbi:MAG: hypothetical protein AAF843_19515 [Bacteroidota bacterium]
MSFADCKSHKNDSEELVYEVRNWFSECGNNGIASASSIWDDYNYFYTDLYEQGIDKGFKPKDVDRLPIGEFITKIKSWNSENR